MLQILITTLVVRLKNSLYSVSRPVYWNLIQFNTALVKFKVRNQFHFQIFWSCSPPPIGVNAPMDTEIQHLK